MKRSPMPQIRTLRRDEPIPDTEPRRYRNADGYVRLRWRIGVNRYVEDYEHRINAGRPHPRLHVHHVNGIKDDNRPENLLVLTAEAHGALHEEVERARDPERGRRFGGYRSATARQKAERRRRREALVVERSREMARLYIEEHLSTTEIAQVVGLHSSTVSRHLRASGVLMRPRSTKDQEKVLARSQQIVKARAGMRCERCGRDTKWVGGQVHHRRPRASGGSLRDDTNLPANLILLCVECHGWVESHREVAYDTGLLVHQEHNPELISADTWRGPYFFDNDGCCEPLETHIGDTP